MNAIASASIQRPGRAAEGGPKGQGQSAATGGQLPDFAALLGMTLALGDLEQQLGGGAAKAGAAAPDASAGLACGALGIGEEPATDKTGEEGDANAAQGLMALLQAQGAPAAALAGAAAQQTTGEVEEGAAQQPNLAQLMAQTPAGQPRAAEAAAAQGTEATRTWNVQELAHQIKAAFGQMEHHATPATAGALTGKAEGGKHEAQALMATLAQGQGQDGGQAAIQPVAGGPNGQGAGQQLFTAPDPRFKAQLAAAAMAGAKEQAADSLEADPADAQAAPVTAAPLAWSAKPVQGAKMPEMAEQVKQVADFLAERTEGVVKLGLNGVEANLKLYPPDLGGVRVQMTVGNDGTTQAQFIVERAETAQLLQQHLKSFQQGLESRGLTVERVQVTVQGTVRPGSAGSESGWRQEGSASQGFRREETATGERGGGQNSRRQGRERQQQQGFGGNFAW